MVKMLRKLRKEKGLSMKELGEIIGVAESTISQYETGKRDPDFETLLKFSNFFHVSADYLLTGIKTEKENISFNDFTYAMYEESKELSEENKEKLLELAKFFKEQQEKGKGE